MELESKEAAIPSRDAFTLIELLVVVTNIVVLIALLVRASDRLVRLMERRIEEERHVGLSPPEPA